MNPDIWPIAVAHFYDLASRGVQITGFVGWTTGTGEFYNAEGPLTPFTEEATHTIGLSGELAQVVPALPNAFHPMQLDITKKIGVPPTPDATFGVTDLVTRRQVVGDDPFAAYPWFHDATTAWIFQNWPGDDYVDVWLKAPLPNFAWVTSVVEAVLTSIRH